MYAAGRHALGICDRCGLTYKLKNLRNLIVNTRITHIKVCPECWEKDQPQYRLGKFKIFDPQALRDARPDTNRAVSIGLGGWNPIWVGSMQMSLGVVEVN